jgi:bifunctional pyridoxal-dependent enzyme with beta-cystathionase and maltose regulon repressor activities
MGKRWSAEEIRNLRTLAAKHSAQAIAEGLIEPWAGWSSRLISWG